jgi:hypothetical protein
MFFTIITKNKPESLDSWSAKQEAHRTRIEKGLESVQLSKKSPLKFAFVRYAGELEPSELNPTPEQLMQSYQEGRRLAREYWLFDKETVIDELRAADPAIFEEHKDACANLPPMQHVEHWMAMFHSGMKPVDHIELPIIDAFRLKREVELIDPPKDAIISFIECDTFLGMITDGS